MKLRKAQDRELYNALFALYGHTAYYAAYRVLREMKQSETAVLAVFGRLLPFLSSLSPLERDEVRYLVIMLCGREAEKMLRGEGVKPSVGAWDAATETAKVRGDALSELAVLLEKLPEELLDTLFLCCDCQLSAEAAAELLELTPEEVGRRLLAVQSAVFGDVEEEGENG